MMTNNKDVRNIKITAFSLMSVLLIDTICFLCKLNLNELVTLIYPVSHAF